MYLAFDDSTSDTSPTSEHHQPPHPMEVEGTLNELEWKDFYESLSEGFLPHDGEQRAPFDQTLHFEVGDPHATGRKVGRTGFSCSSTCCNSADISNTMMLSTFW